MMNKEKWQQELGQMQLNDSQKQRMKQYVKSAKPKRKVDWMYRIAVPTFVLLALLFVYLSVGERSGVQLIHQASIPPEYAVDHNQYFKRIVLHLWIIFGLLLMNSVLGVAVLMQTFRWKQPFVSKLRKVIRMLRYPLLFLMPIIAVAIMYAFIIFNWPIIAMKCVILLLIISTELFVILYLARNKTGHIHCPHCQHEITKTEKRKMVAYFKMELRCPSCNEKVYYTKKFRQMSGFMSLLISATIIFTPYIGISIRITIPCAILFACVQLFILMPLLMDIEEKEEFLF